MQRRYIDYFPEYKCSSRSHNRRESLMSIDYHDTHMRPLMSGRVLNHLGGRTGKTTAIASMVAGYLEGRMIVKTSKCTDVPWVVDMWADMLDQRFLFKRLLVGVKVNQRMRKRALKTTRSTLPYLASMLMEHRVSVIKRAYCALRLLDLLGRTNERALCFLKYMRLALALDETTQRWSRKLDRLYRFLLERQRAELVSLKGRCH
jgi:hypothetical protein